MTFAQRRNRLTTHFSERMPVVKRRISVLLCTSITALYNIVDVLVHKFPELNVFLTVHRELTIH